MTQHRDWQKDMDDLSHYFNGLHLVYHNEQTLRGTPLADVLHYWLQEADRLKKRDESNERALHRMTVRAEAEKARADAAESQNESWERKWRKTDYARHSAEAREQLLKEAIETYLLEFMPHHEAAPLFQKLLSTLYPDTPAPAAPKEGAPDESID